MSEQKTEKPSGPEGEAAYTGSDPLFLSDWRSDRKKQPLWQKLLIWITAGSLALILSVQLFLLPALKKTEKPPESIRSPQWFESGNTPVEGEPLLVFSYQTDLSGRTTVAIEEVQNHPLVLKEVSLTLFQGNASQTRKADLSAEVWEIISGRKWELTIAPAETELTGVGILASGLDQEDRMISYRTYIPMKK